MATIKIEIATDNAAFADDYGEVARILTALAADFRNGSNVRDKLRDSNGNTVGSVTVEE